MHSGPMPLYLSPADDCLGCAPHALRSTTRTHARGPNRPELLYADDTVLASTDAGTLTALLHPIQREARIRRLSFNKTKCVAVPVNCNPQMHFLDGRSNEADANSNVPRSPDFYGPHGPADIRVKIGKTWATFKKMKLLL